MISQDRLDFKGAEDLDRKVKIVLPYSRMKLKCDGNPVVLKRFDASEYKFEDEVMRAKALGDHPNCEKFIGVVDPLKIPREDYSRFPKRGLVADIRGGIPLEQFMECPGVEKRGLIKIGLGVFRGLRHMFSCGIPFKEVDLRNILVRTNFEAVVPLNKTYGVRYVAPEIFMDAVPQGYDDKASYIWGFGIFLLRVYQESFPGGRTHREMYQFFKNSKPFNIPPKCPSALKQVIGMCLDYDIKRRCSVVFDKLEEIFTDFQKNEINRLSPLHYQKMATFDKISTHIVRRFGREIHTFWRDLASHLVGGPSENGIRVRSYQEGCCNEVNMGISLALILSDSVHPILDVVDALFKIEKKDLAIRYFIDYIPFSYIPKTARITFGKRNQSYWEDLCAELYIDDRDIKGSVAIQPNQRHAVGYSLELVRHYAANGGTVGKMMLALQAIHQRTMACWLVPQIQPPKEVQCQEFSTSGPTQITVQQVQVQTTAPITTSWSLGDDIKKYLGEDVAKEYLAAKDGYELRMQKREEKRSKQEKTLQAALELLSNKREKDTKRQLEELRDLNQHYREEIKEERAKQGEKAIGALKSVKRGKNKSKEDLEKELQEEALRTLRAISSYSDESD